MSIWQTILVFVVIPAAAYGLIALLATGGRSKRAPRYRPGQQWNYPAVWWAPNPAGVGAGGHGSEQIEGAQHADSANQPGAVPAVARTAKGGARGNW